METDGKHLNDHVPGKHPAAAASISPSPSHQGADYFCHSGHLLPFPIFSLTFPPTLCSGVTPVDFRNLYRSSPSTNARINFNLLTLILKQLRSPPGILKMFLPHQGNTREESKARIGFGLVGFFLRLRPSRNRCIRILSHFPRKRFLSKGDG